MSDSSGSQLAVYVRPASASWGLFVWCDRDILAGYHLGSAGSIRAKTGVPGGEDKRGGVRAGVMAGLRAVAPYVTSSGGLGLVAVAVYQLVVNERFGFGLCLCQGHGGVLGRVFVREYSY